MKVKVDKTLVASVALHVLVIGWGLVSFSTKALEVPPEDSVPVDVISADQLAKVMAGMKTGKKENPKPLVEKVAEAKPVDDAVGKITEKAPVVTETAPPPQPKVEEKPVEKKPDPPKPVAESKPKEEPKPIEKKPEPPKVDPIAEAIKKEEKKPPPKPVQAAKPPRAAEAEDRERTFDQTQIAALLDKRDPTRQAVDRRHAEFECRARPREGHGGGQFRDLGLDVPAAGRALLEEAVWRHRIAEEPEAVFDIRLKRDGTLEGAPVPEGAPATPFLRVYQESALRAIIECQPYKLPAAIYEEWKYFAPVFDPKQMFHHVAMTLWKCSQSNVE